VQRCRVAGDGAKNNHEKSGDRDNDNDQDGYEDRHQPYPLSPSVRGKVRTTKGTRLA
jgi:hypothetical protein